MAPKTQVLSHWPRRLLDLDFTDTDAVVTLLNDMVKQVGSPTEIAAHMQEDKSYDDFILSKLYDEQNTDPLLVNPPEQLIIRLQCLYQWIDTYSKDGWAAERHSVCSNLLAVLGWHEARLLGGFTEAELLDLELRVKKNDDALAKELVQELYDRQVELLDQGNALFDKISKEVESKHVKKQLNELLKVVDEQIRLVEMRVEKLKSRHEKDPLKFNEDSTNVENLSCWNNILNGGSECEGGLLGVRDQLAEKIKSEQLLEFDEIEIQAAGVARVFKSKAAEKIKANKGEDASFLDKLKAKLVNFFKNFRAGLKISQIEDRFSKDMKAKLDIDPDELPTHDSPKLGR